MKTKPGTVEEFVKLAFILGDHKPKIPQMKWICTGMACSFSSWDKGEFDEHIIEIILENGFHLARS